MSQAAKPKAYLLYDAGRNDLSLRKFASVLERLADFVAIDAAVTQNWADLEVATGGAADPAAIVFIDAAWAERNAPEFSETWLARNPVLVTGNATIGTALAEWRERVSWLALGKLANADLARVTQLLLAPDRHAGVTALGDRNAEVYFEKILGLGEIGQKLDRVAQKVEKAYPALVPQIFNLRQLGYSVLHEAFALQAPVVDAQLSANPDRLLFSARFAAPAGSAQRWQSAIVRGSSLAWRNAYLGADALVLTELRAKGEVEIKALIGKSAGFDTEGDKSLLVRAIEDFRPEAIAAEAERQARFLPLHVLGNATVSAVMAEAARSVAAEDAPVDGFALQMRGELLEKEKGNLQALVQKKSDLIANLQKDVGRAQRDLVNAQNTHSRELQKLRLGEEKARSDAREAVEKMRRMQARADEGRLSGKAAEADAKRDFEKEWKQAEHSRRIAEERVSELSAKLVKGEETIAGLRKEIRTLSGEMNELRANSQRAEKILGAKEREERRSAEVAVPVAAKAEEVGGDKLKEAQKAAQDAAARAMDLDKEVKRLLIKLESFELNSKAKAQSMVKQLAAAEKAAEDAKRFKTEALRKLAEKEIATKKRLEETNEIERRLKAKIDELSAQIAELKRKAA